MNSLFNRRFAADIAAKLPSHRRSFATTIIQSHYRGHLVPTLYRPKPKRGRCIRNQCFIDNGLLRSVPDGCISVQGEWYDRRIDWNQVTVARGPLEAQLVKQIASRRIKKRRKIDALHGETAILGLVSKIAANRVNEDIKEVTTLSRIDAEERVVEFAKVWCEGPSGAQLWTLDDHGNFTPFNSARINMMRGVLTASTVPDKDCYGEVMVTLHNPRETRRRYTDANMTAHAMLRGSATREAPYLVKVRSKYWGYQMLRHGQSWHSSPRVANSGVYVQWYRPYGEVRNDPSGYATHASRRGEVVTSLVFTPTALAVLRRAVLAKLRFVSKHALEWLCEKIGDPIPIVLAFLLSARTIKFRGEYVQ